MSITKTTDGIYKLTTNIEDILFEGIWEIPNGVSLNSYVVKGEKTALIDGFCGWDGYPATFISKLESMDITLDSLDYIIINHMEPDHSGWIEDVRHIKEDVKIICSKAAKDLLDVFYGHTENIEVVKTGDTLDLGNGRILDFVSIPNVHWPDTIVTFDRLSGTLFSCDAFGSYGSINDDGYDDLLDQAAIDFFEKEAVRYYANIVATFSPAVIRAIGKCEPLPIKIVAPGHGIVWRKNPTKIIEDYARYASYQKGPAKNKVTVLWGSMYGMSEKGMNVALDTLKDLDVEVAVHNVMENSWGTMLTSVWESTGVILAMPTYENKMFPPVAAILEEICKKKALNKIAFRLGSYGWGGGAEKELAKIMEENKSGWTFLENVEYKGSLGDEDASTIVVRVKELVAKVNELTQ